MRRGTDRLFDGGGVVEAVALQDVDVLELEALQTLLDRVEDVLYHTQNEYIRVGSHWEVWGEGAYLAVEAVLVDDPLLHGGLRVDVPTEGGCDGEEDFGEDDELFARELEFFDRFSEHHLRAPVGVHLHGAQAGKLVTIQCTSGVLTFAVSKVWMP